MPVGSWWVTVLLKTSVSLWTCAFILLFERGCVVYNCKCGYAYFFLWFYLFCVMWSEDLSLSLFFFPVLRWWLSVKALSSIVVLCGLEIEMNSC